jgi:hypothetical protein
MNCERSESDNKPNCFSDGIGLSGNTALLTVRRGRNLKKKKDRKKTFSQHTSPAQ